jgi:hypothetical protein
MKNSRLVVGAFFSVALFAVHFADAKSIYEGQPVEFQYYYDGGAYGPPVRLAAPGATRFDHYFRVHVGKNKIKYTYVADTTWSPSVTSLDSNGLYVDSGAVIYSVGNEPKIGGVSLDPSSQLGSSGFDTNNITFNSSAVAVTWMNLTFEAGDTVILDIGRAARGSDDGALRPDTPVPEPATWAIMLIGIAGVGAAARAARRGRVSLSCAA